MQGAFSGVGTNWANVLNPGPDEETLTEQRRKISEAEADFIARGRRAAADGGPPPVRNPDETPVPHAPSTCFSLKEKQYFVIQFPPDTPLRNGIWGHYLVPYKIVGGRGRPFTGDQLSSPNAVPDNAPGKVQGDPKPEPDPNHCKPKVHYITPTLGKYYEIGIDTLRKRLQSAESADLAFARRMEGMGNVMRNTVWACIDPDFNPGDRQGVLDQFLHKYLDRFYTRLEPGNSPDTRDVIEEGLHKHKEFCVAWTQKHYHTLTPNVTAPAEALASDFYPFLEQMFPPDAHLTRAELARLLMRHEEFAPDFASCLHYFTANLEQTRGGRNASYKQMSQTSNLKVISYNRLGNMLGAKKNLIDTFLQTFKSPESVWLDVLLVDWYSILGQIPHVHRYFDDDAAIHEPRSRASAVVPPWRVARG